MVTRISIFLLCLVLLSGCVYDLVYDKNSPDAKAMRQREEEQRQKQQTQSQEKPSGK